MSLSLGPKLDDQVAMLRDLVQRWPDAATAKACPVPGRIGVCLGAATLRGGGECFGAFQRGSCPTVRFEEMFAIPGLLARRTFPLAVSSCDAAEEESSSSASLQAVTLVQSDADELLLIEVVNAAEAEADADADAEPAAAATTVRVHAVEFPDGVAVEQLLLCAGTFPKQVVIVTEADVCVCSASIVASEDGESSVCKLSAVSKLASLRSIEFATVSPSRDVLALLGTNDDDAAVGTRSIVVANVDNIACSSAKGVALPASSVAACALAVDRFGADFVVLTSRQSKYTLEPLEMLVVVNSNNDDNDDGAGGIRAQLPVMRTASSSSSHSNTNAPFLRNAFPAPSITVSNRDDVSCLHFDANGALVLHEKRGGRFVACPLVQGCARSAGSDAAVTFSASLAATSSGAVTVVAASVDTCIFPFRDGFIVLEPRGNVRLISRGGGVVETSVPCFSNFSRIIRSCALSASCSGTASATSRFVWLCDGDGGVACCTCPSASSAAASPQDDADRHADSRDDTAAAAAESGVWFENRNANEATFTRITSIASVAQNENAKSAATSTSALLSHQQLQCVVMGALARPQRQTQQPPSGAFGAVVVDCSHATAESPPRLVSNIIELPLRPSCSHCTEFADGGSVLLLCAGGVGGVAFCFLTRMEQADSASASSSSSGVYSSSRVMLLKIEMDSVVGIFDATTCTSRRMKSNEDAAGDGHHDDDDDDHHADDDEPTMFAAAASLAPSVSGTALLWVLLRDGTLLRVRIDRSMNAALLSQHNIIIGDAGATTPQTLTQTQTQTQTSVPSSSEQAPVKIKKMASPSIVSSWSLMSDDILSCSIASEDEPAPVCMSVDLKTFIPS